MANQMYGYPPPSYGGGNGYYPSRAPTDPYLSDPSMMNHSTRYPTSDPLSAPPDPSSQYASSFMNRGQPSSMYYNAPNDGYRYPVSDMGGVGGVGGYSGGMSHVAPTNSQPSWPGAVDVGGTFDPVGAKRSNEALYHQTVLDAQNTFGQSEALFTMNTIPKRPRYESATSLPIYPQRPGEKDCAHYMQTRACRYGENCKFDHPVWVPEGGIPDWKEVTVYYRLLILLGYLI
ncbi:hypothetical protein GIB67_035295 [Kingdonia uniflora]|uniref:C3H1-type domain-containing protein n=1 Tax=Kingdonia uniflora TaxID=39325 RepID=A0A7J7KY73_9MAGN|nr:hypothetical protein GIB67_035295 [Kingdonia uniflora]